MWWGACDIRYVVTLIMQVRYNTKSSFSHEGTVFDSHSVGDKDLTIAINARSELKGSSCYLGVPSKDERYWGLMQRVENGAVLILWRAVSFDI